MDNLWMAQRAGKKTKEDAYGTSPSDVRGFLSNLETKPHWNSVIKTVDS